MYFNQLTAYCDIIINYINYIVLCHANMPFFDGWEEFYKIFIVIEGKGGRYGSFCKYIKQLITSDKFESDSC